MTKKEERIAVFNKFDGHCAYCGQAIKLNGFEVDHIEALRRTEVWGGSDEIKNKFPACLPCNRGKSTFTVEKWRGQLQNKITSLNRDSATYRAAKRFGLVIETTESVLFYFERFNNLNISNNEVASAFDEQELRSIKIACTLMQRKVNVNSMAHHDITNIIEKIEKFI